MQGMVPLSGFGGVPYSAVRKAAPRNILDNSDFRNPVMQAGLGGMHGAALYAIDRWIYNGSADHLSLNDGNGLSFAQDHVIYQLLAFPVTEKAHTLAIWLSDGTIGCVTLSGQYASVGNTGFSATHNGENRVYINKVGVAKSPIKYVALYEGEYTAETLPDYHPKGYGAELAECQRYYQRFHYKQYETIAMGFEASGYAFIQLSVNNMRLKFPTMTISAPIQIGSRTYMPTGCNINNGTIIIGLNYDTTTTNVGACYAYCPSAGGCVIELNEDL